MFFAALLRRRGVRIAIAAFLLIQAVPATVGAYLLDGTIHRPPTTGAFAYYSTYGNFGPDRPGFVAQGQSYIDPVFGSTVRRLTHDYPGMSWSSIYAKNGFWNADATRMLHHSPNGGYTVIDSTTGATLRTGLPGNDDGSFAPDDPDVWYYFSGSSLRKYSIASGTTSLVKTFSGTLGALGGSVDSIDATGRYMVLNIGGSARVWDKQSDVLYAGSISGNVGTGWIGISPDGKYMVTAADGRAHTSYAINHTTHTVSTSGVLFWTLCGDHGDLVTASNGKTYFVTWECDSDPGIWAVDITIPQTYTDLNKQRADNRKLLATDWSDSGHISGVSRGALQDWAFVSVESQDDAFTSGVSTWRPYMQEIVMTNVLTGEVRRLAHHRSRGLPIDYSYQPRVNASWDGTKIAWASNFGYAGTSYSDIYAMDIVGGSFDVAITSPAASSTVGGSVLVGAAAPGAVQFVLYADNLKIVTKNAPDLTTLTWASTYFDNGAHTLKVTSANAAGDTSSTTQSITVSNSVTGPITGKFSSPSANATVTGTITYNMSVGNVKGTTNLKVTMDGKTLKNGRILRGSPSGTWDTTKVANGTHTLVMTVTDTSGRAAATASLRLTVAN